MIRKLYTYWKRGHNIYIAMMLSMINFIVIQYRLLIEKIPILNMIVPSMSVFILLFLFVAVPLTVIIGKFDYKRGLFKTEVTTAFDHHPRLTELLENVKDTNERVKRLEGIK